VRAIILAKHPEKLKDFRNHGRFTQLRVLHFRVSLWTKQLCPQKEKLQPQSRDESQASLRSLVIKLA